MINTKSGEITIPEPFMTLVYNPKQIPSSVLSIVTHGANCQLFAYSLLKHFGYDIPPFRSSDLWDDTTYTYRVETLKPLDLVLYHNKPESWGAHVGLCMGNDKIIHLSKQNNKPEVCTHDDFKQQSRYAFFIGAKRLC